jgi:DNA-binding LacI/PurR family transcriptional regulator
MSGEKTTALSKKLTEEISSGKFAPLGVIPSERALMARFNVSRETVRKALRILEGMGLVYVSPGRGTFVSGSGRGRQYIGVLLSGCRNTEIFRRIGKAICAMAKDNGLDVICEDASSLDAEKSVPRAIDFAKRLVAMKVAGVVMQPLEFIPDAAEKNMELLSMFDRAGIPVVLLDCDVVPSPGRSAYDKVGIDNLAAGRLVGAHLVECGAKCVLCCANPFFPESVRDRFDGVGMACPEVIELEAAPDDTRKLGRVLKEHPEVDAVVCQNDVYAIVLMASLRKLRRKIPDDIMVAGFDGLNFSKVSSPTLTTIAQPVDDIAEAAFDRIVMRIAGRAPAPAEISLPSPLVVQKSTKMKHLGSGSL